jgi:hypothetical protein
MQGGRVRQKWKKDGADIEEEEEDPFKILMEK